MSLNSDKYKEGEEFCSKEYVRACVKLIPQQMFLEMKNDLEQQVELTKQPLSLDSEFIKQYQDDLKNSINEALDDKQPRSDDIDDKVFNDYLNQMKEDNKKVIAATGDIQIKQILNEHPLVKLSESDLKKFFARQEYLMTENDSFSPFGNAYYHLTTQDAETISEAIHAPEFWTWIAEVNGWLKSLSKWQQDVTTKFKDWKPEETDSLKKLHESLSNLPNPGSPPSGPPTQLKGRII